MRVRDLYRFSDGRSVFVGPIESGPPSITAATCDVLVDGDLVQQVEVTEELPERREPSPDRVLSTYAAAAVTAETVQERDVRLRER